jgi:polar amino acid transport system ATP-binding protein
MANIETPILEVKSLSKSFGKVDVFNDISFTMKKGTAMAIIGSSGSGKTTLLRCLNLLETPNHGQIFVHGKCLFDADDISTHQEKDIRYKRLHFGLVFQSFNLFPQYSALKNVSLASELLAKEQPEYRSKRNLLMKEIQEKAVYLLGQVGLSDKLYNYPHELSGGQQQRVAIARALAVNPDILCFDEPTSALDPELTGDVLKVIKSLAELNTTMLIVTHEMSFARDVADTVAFMDAGSILEQGPPSQVISNPRETRTRQFLERYLGDK